MSAVRIVAEAFDPEPMLAEFRRGDPGIGAVVSFLGLMRDFSDGQTVERMLLEHYPGMTEKAIEAIVAEARQRWEISRVQVVHRVGVLEPQDPIVLVAVASAHRGDAFAACEFVIDYLKNRATFWKKESTPSGERWVAARASDRQAEQRWQRED